ncbi:hypothetical protein WAI453_001556 [Rhynchosporium graminicola]
MQPLTACQRASASAPVKAFFYATELTAAYIRISEKQVLPLGHPAVPAFVARVIVFG